MQDFKTLRVWLRARQFVSDVYQATRLFPRHERYGLTTQLRRSAISIASNIAEGAGRGTGPDFARFVDLALGSANEVECQLILANDLGFIDERALDDLVTQLEAVRRMGTSLSKKLKSATNG